MRCLCLSYTLAIPSAGVFDSYTVKFPSLIKSRYGFWHPQGGCPEQLTPCLHLATVLLFETKEGRREFIFCDLFFSRKRKWLFTEILFLLGLLLRLYGAQCITLCCVSWWGEGRGGDAADACAASVHRPCTVWCTGEFTELTSASACNLPICSSCSVHRSFTLSSWRWSAVYFCVDFIYLLTYCLPSIAFRPLSASYSIR